MSQTRPCKRCGCKATVLMDGKRFCSRCNEQIEEFFEIEEDEEAGRMNATISQLLRMPKIKKSGFEDPDNEELHDQPTPPELSIPESSQKKGATKRKPRNPEDEKLPEEYLELLYDIDRHPKDENIGISAIRVGTLSKVLWKISSMMIVELGYPEIFSNQVHCILQLYLKKSGIAFVEKEYTENPKKMLRKKVAVKKSKRTVTENLRKLKLEKKKKGMSRLEQSMDVWDLLQSTQMTENFELSSEDDDLNETKYEAALSDTEIVIVDTKVHKKAVKQAEKVYFNLDIVVGILYVAAISSGCIWTTISDIVRWLREDRGKIFGHLSKFNDWTQGSGCVNFISIFTSMKVPLYEYHRSSIYLWQLVDIDTSRISLDFPQIISRFLYNLNLPTKILEKTLYLLDCAPPSEILDKTYITQQGEIPEIPVCEKNLTFCFGKRNHHLSKFRSTDVFISTETKILAYVLLALKLTFGLDDKREYNFKDGSFDIAEWIYQQKMRIMIWEGHDIKDVVNTVKINYPLSEVSTIIDDAIGFGTRGKDNEIRFKMGLRQNIRVGQVSTCIPSVTPCETAFHLNNPLKSCITDRSTDRNDEDRIYAPIQGQLRIIKHYINQKRTEEEQQALNNEIDTEAYQILIKDFSESKIRVIANGVNTEIFKEKMITEERFTDENDAKDWLKMFPCAKAYIRFARPFWAQGAFICKPKENNKAREDVRSAYLTYRVVADLYMAASKTFSYNFQETLDLLCKSISEHKFVLYAAFSLLETQIINRGAYKKLCKALIDGETVALNTITRYSKSKDKFRDQVFNIKPKRSIEEPRELRWLAFSKEGENKQDSESESEIEDEAENDSFENEEFSEDKVKFNKSKGKGAILQYTYYSMFLYDWERYWHLIAMRYW